MFDDSLSNTVTTPLAQALQRVRAANTDDVAERFLLASYVAECALKLLAIGLQVGLKEKAPEHSYEMAHDLTHADGLGTWEHWIRKATSQPLAGFLSPALTSLLVWASKSRSKDEQSWFSSAKSDIEELFGILQLESGLPDRRPCARDLLSALVQLRNKTKAHGAVGADFFCAANEPYARVIAAFIARCPIFSWRWLHLERRESGKIRGVWLSGPLAHHAKKDEIDGLQVGRPGIYLWPPKGPRPLCCASLLASNRECTEFLLPNGNVKASGGSFINYANGQTRTVDISAYSRTPAPLPASETEGLCELDVQSNVFGNLPEMGIRYVPRPKLESDLHRRLRDRNHPVITLHGRGGIGKTSLALKAAHSLAADESNQLFDHIVWFSARDIDLRPQGPAPVRPAVSDIHAVAMSCGRFFSIPATTEALAKLLQGAPGGTGPGILFILDNFETMDDPAGLHEFLDTHTHLPNKVLITSRERAFKADYPIVVYGMERAEAFELMSRASRDLQIEPLVSERAMERIFDYAQGHPYVMRVLIGEIAKEGRYVPPKTALPQRADIVHAVFERSFNKLSADGRRVFLTISARKSIISEMALIVVLGEHGVDVEKGTDECLRLSLVECRHFLDNQPAYLAPHVARLFGRKKFEADPDRLIIQESLSILEKFGVLPVGEEVRVPQDEHLRRFVERVVQEGEGTNRDQQSIDSVLERVAELWPDAWDSLAEFRVLAGARPELVEYAFRRATEERPTDKTAWLRRAKYALSQGDDTTHISCRLRAVELAPDDVYLLSQVASDVAQHVTERSNEIPVARRGVYLASIRDKLRLHEKTLHANDLSRLAWLYLLEGNREDAQRIAALGLRKEPTNRHCRGLVERINREAHAG